MAKKKTIKNLSPVLESNLVAERIDDTYETKLRTTTTFNKHAIVETEVTMKKPDDLAANYVANNAKVKVNGVEVSGGGGYPEPTGTIEITENGTANVKDYAEANVNVPTYPEPTGTITITENGTVNVKDYAEASVNVEGYSETLLWENPNPNAAFASQALSEITRAIYEEYDAFRFVIISTATSAEPAHDSFMLYKTNTSYPYSEVIIFPAKIGGVLYSREILQSSTLRIYDTNNRNADNIYCVPYQIYGIKF